MYCLSSDRKAGISYTRKFSTSQKQSSLLSQQSTRKFGCLNKLYILFY
jgi:hypothetical protein